jgi:membrane-bound metal-dependent hydrolase YbcI (DUF457 family)
LLQIGSFWYEPPPGDDAGNDRTTQGRVLMADYKTHITFSSLLAGCLTGIAGMLPDLDSETGKPIREVFGFTAAIAPLVLSHRLHEWGGSNEGALLLAVMLYATIRYGAMWVLGMATVHRGMFHSIPALVIAAELTFLSFKGYAPQMRLLLALGVGLGFASHLILDEVYSVEWTGIRVKLKSSAGSAVKFIGKDWGANILAYGLLFTLSYAVLTDAALKQIAPRYALPPPAIDSPIRR